VCRIVRLTAEAFGADADVDFARTYPAVINDETSTALAKAAAEAVGWRELFEMNLIPSHSCTGRRQLRR
jgi:metal-dependent amidase/aminoacylase/carboxypeptidase family protein